MIAAGSKTSPKTNASARRLLIRLAFTAAFGCSCLTHAAAAPGVEPDEAALPLATLYFTPALTPAPIQQAPGQEPANPTDLAFHPGAIIDADRLGIEARTNPLAVASDLVLLRLQVMEAQRASRDNNPERPRADAAGPVLAPAGFSLRFQDSQRAGALWSRTALAPGAGLSRFEVLPALYLRSGRVHDTGFESLDYADLYAELGVDISTNTGLWLRYERLRQALGQQRVGEQVDADALFVQFELRF